MSDSYIFMSLKPVDFSRFQISCAACAGVEQPTAESVRTQLLEKLQREEAPAAALAQAGAAVSARGPPPLSAEAALVYGAVRESAAHYRAGLRDVLREAIAALEAPGDLPAHSGSESGSESAASSDA